MTSDIIIKSRESLTMSGVSEVLGFDSDFVSAMTEDGRVEIEGDNLKILAMSSETGNLHITGRIDGVFYSAKPKEKKRLFGSK